MNQIANICVGKKNRLKRNRKICFIRSRYHCTPIRMGKIQNTDRTKCWWGCKAIGTHSLLVLWKTAWQFLLKLNINFPYDPAVLIIDINPHELEIYVHKNLHMNVYNSFIYNCQQLETTNMFFSWQTGKQTVVHPYNQVLFSTKKKPTIKLWKDMEGLKRILLSKRSQAGKATFCMIPTT